MGRRRNLVSDLLQAKLDVQLSKRIEERSLTLVAAQKQEASQLQTVLEVERLHWEKSNQALSEQLKSQVSYFIADQMQ